MLVGASPGLADPAERAARREADDELATRIETLTIEAFAARVGRPAAVRRPAGAGRRAARNADRLRNTPAGLAAALRGPRDGRDGAALGAAAELVIPVTLVVGERDEKFLALAEAMQARLPNAQLVIVPEAGHAAQLENPAAVAEAIHQSGLSSSSASA